MNDNILVTQEEKVVINHMPVVIRSADRSLVDIGKWWTSLQEAESNYYANRTNLYDLYATVELDGHLSGLIGKRIAKVINKRIYYKVGDKKIDAMDKLIGGSKFREVRKGIQQQKIKGLYGFEFLPGPELDFNIIPIKHIKPERKVISSEQWGMDGFNYEKVWNIWVLGDKDDFGLLLKCSPYAIWKKGNMADWAQYIEVFGQPMIIFTYDAHDPKVKKELDEMMKAIGSGTKMQVPKQVELKMEDGKQNNGNGELQDKFRNACNAEMSVIVLGATETTTSSKSSGYAQSKEHGKQQDELLQTDIIDHLNALNSKELYKILKSYNWPVSEDGEFVLEEEVDLSQMKDDLEIDEKLEKIGVPLGHDYYYEKYNRPKPKDYDAILEEKKANKPQPGADPAKEEKPKPKPVKKESKEEATFTFWEGIRNRIANFFAQAPKD